MIFTTNPSPLDKVCNHDYNADTLFPHHTPEGIECGWKRTLCPYVSFRPLEAIYVICVDIIHPFLLAWHLQQSYSTVVIWKGNEWKIITLVFAIKIIIDKDLHLLSALEQKCTLQ